VLEEQFNLKHGNMCKFDADKTYVSTQIQLAERSDKLYEHPASADAGTSSFYLNNQKLEHTRQQHV
jgi:hypothetical protein